MSLHKVARTALVALTLSAIVGCGGSQTGSINGTVAFQGKPIAGGTISFVSKEQPQLGALTFAINADGTYSATGVPYGELQVSVVPSVPATMGDATSKAKAAMGQAEASGQEVSRAMLDAASPITNVTSGQQPTFPDIYMDPTTSGITFTLDKSVAEYPIDLR